MAIHLSVAIAAQYFASTADATAATKLGYTRTEIAPFCVVPTTDLKTIFL